MAHHFPLRVYYEDTDAGGVVYYANYLKFAERGRTEWLRELGIDQSNLREKQGIFFVVRRCEVDYQAPGKLDDELIVETRLLRLSNASIAMQQNIQRKADGTLLAALEVIIVCVNEQLKATRLPQNIRAILENETEE